MDVVILGLDVSTNSGVSVLRSTPNNPPELVYTGHIKAPKKDDQPQMARIAGAAQQLLTLMSEHTPSMIVIEGYSMASRNPHITTFEFGGVLRYFLWQEGYTPVEVPPTTLKKFVTGAGNAKKDVMIKEVYKRFGVDTASNDIADAVGLAYFGAALLGHHKMPKSNGEALKAVSFCEDLHLVHHNQ